jgi:eukaryotic-like serine/threonine-protein kinase
MTNPSHQREQDLFHACVDLAPRERSAFLDDAASGDPSLRERVEHLLDAHLRAERSTLRPLASLSLDQVPDRIGSYRLTRSLGEGGMGVVYEAEQEEPVRRRVALKIVKSGPGDGQVVARLAYERQALAAMDHAYVTRLFDAGETAAGRPYFVMELVEGVPLLEYCDREALTIRQRVELLALVCEGVEHAHQKGVIHRDLKPSNILVSSRDGRPIPKIIDFGIAKAVGLDVASSPTRFTRLGQAMGTLAYMSPEQAVGRDVDTRADVYSLGVILYEMLTGLLPVDPGGMSQADFLARLAHGELEPVRPSARAERTRDGAGEAAARRKTVPAAHRRELAGDLDWIVMKALDPDRSRRYGTASALGEDLRCFLRVQPVAARPPSARYRMAKFVRRHRLQVAAAAVAVLALVAGAVGAGVGLRRATRAEAEARREAATAREVSAFLVRLFEVSDPGEARGNSITARELLDRGAQSIESELGTEPEVKADLLGTLGRVHLSLGLYRQTAALAERALVLHRAAGGGEDLKTAALQLSLGRAQRRLAEFAPARANLESALAIRRRHLGEDHLDVAEVLDALGTLDWEVQRWDAATAHHERALAIQRRVAGPDHVAVAVSLRSLGRVQLSQDRFEAALALHLQAQPILEKAYGERHPKVADGLDALGLAHQGLKQFAEARRYYERAMEIRRATLGSTHPFVAYSCHNLGRLLTEKGELRAALPLYEEGIRIREASLGPDSPMTAALVESLAILRIRLGETDHGRRLLERSLRSYERAYAPDHGEVLESHSNMVTALVLSKRYAEAIPHIRHVVRHAALPGYQIDLKNADFDPMRSMPAFRELQREAEERAARPRDPQTAATR